MNSRYTVLLQITTVPFLREKANDLLSLAMKHPESADVLPACATVILAAALDQGTKDILSGAAAQYAAENDTPASATRYTTLFGETLRKRMLRTPEVLTNGKYQLDPHSPYTQTLHMLINIRNRLMHITDEPRILSEFSDDVQIADNKMIVATSIPKSPWSVITAEDARKYEAAVDIYFKEVLFPESGEILDGKIVIRAA